MVEIEIDLADPLPMRTSYNMTYILATKFICGCERLISHNLKTYNCFLIQRERQPEAHRVLQRRLRGRRGGVGLRLGAVQEEQRRHGKGKHPHGTRMQLQNLAAQQVLKRIQGLFKKRWPIGCVIPHPWWINAT